MISHWHFLFAVGFTALSGLPVHAAEDCPTATQIVQQASEQVDELKPRQTSLWTQIQTASSSLAYPALVSLLEAQLATKQSLIAAWDIIAATTRAHPTCWPPGMAGTVGSAAAKFAAETRRSLEGHALMRDRAREVARAQLGAQSR